MENRVIKFRAWYGEKIGMLSPSFNGDINEIFQEKNGIYMQYTGLKDKNSAEIYEGDVFRWEDNAIGVIKYQDGSFYLQTDIELPGDSFSAHGVYSPWLRTVKHELETELEIIGNLYENPELLDVKRNEK